ncbi:hypothetical protein RIF29_18404 [Crotalaria pallida]|uniref:non-specific serine/threonine protein kinase n=1 Tax=Crotalaria pallida TaxID=3830 RepID=A0AAN9IDV8_CROPI
MLAALCTRPKPSFLSLFLNHHSPRFNTASSLHFSHSAAADGRRHHSSACTLGGSCGGAASIWHVVLPSNAGSVLRGGIRRSSTELRGEGSWNAAWDARPARWLHRPDSAWLLFGVCACLAPPLLLVDVNNEVPLAEHDSDAGGGDLKGSGGCVEPNESADYKVKGVLADGRCLFRAIAHGACLIHGEEAPDENRQRELADELRAQVVDELRRRREETEWFIEGDFDAYVERIQQPFVWGGEPELLMASHVLKTPISVFMRDRSSGDLVNIAKYGEEYNKKEKELAINVLFHGYGHYDILETLSDQRSFYGVIYHHHHGSGTISFTTILTHIIAIHLSFSFSKSQSNTKHETCSINVECGSIELESLNFIDVKMMLVDNLRKSKSTCGWVMQVRESCNSKCTVTTAMTTSSSESDTLSLNNNNDNDNDNGNWQLQTTTTAAAPKKMKMKMKMMMVDEEQGGGGTGGGGSLKSWAKQTEESYQLQLALALRLSSLSSSSSSDDLNFLDFQALPSSNSSSSSSSISPQSLSHRFWVNGCLQYSDRVPDGFYLIHGMDAYTWTISSDMQNLGMIPSFESLMSIKPYDDSTIAVVAIDKSRDSGLRELQSRVLGLSSKWITTKDATDQLANIVCSRMGGGSSTEENLGTGWKDCIQILKGCLHSVVLPIGSLPVGLCVHRALLFKVLADLINLPCRIAKGCKYCRKDMGASCIVKFGSDREFIVDLVGMPGAMSQPDSSLNSASSMLIYSPLCHPKFKPVEMAEYTKTLAQLYFLDSQALQLVFDSTSGGAVAHCDRMDLQQTEAFSANFGRGTEEYVSLIEADQSVMGYPSHEVDLDQEDLDIPWSELNFKEHIGTGSFGTVLRADWRGSDVAVKILKVQGFDGERFEEFRKEVSLMKRLRHPNIVLLMGAVIQPPKLSIVTEYLSRGSLYELLQMQGVGSSLSEKRRLSMAYDVASGMNYLHQMKPPIVHRDLKSPNLLVNDTYTVKVCDFGLSRTKANTYLSSRTAAGTPEWMAPEVIRGDQSNEKCDVFSFGVILWELVTLQQPWRLFNPSQVVAAVGFMGKRLEIPSHTNPRVAALIELCWDPFLHFCNFLSVQNLDYMNLGDDLLSPIL